MTTDKPIPKKPRKTLTKLLGTTTKDIEGKNPNRSLNGAQKAFARHWARGESIPTSALRAGYAAGDIGFRLRKDPAILKLYYEEKAKFEVENQMTRKKVMEGLMDGIETAKLLGEPASIINGWKTIGQMCGYFEPVKKTIDINVNGSVQIKRLEAMSDADLLKLIKGEVEEVVFKELEAEDDDENDNEFPALGGV